MKKYNIQYDELYNLYIVENMTQEECAKYYGCSNSYITKTLKLFGIKKDKDKHYDNVRRSTFNNWGVYNISQSKYWKDKYYENEESIHEKFKQTCIEKYGVENPVYTDWWYDKMYNTMIDRYGGWYNSTDEYKEKNYNTKKKNNSFGKSKQELKLFSILKDTYGNENVIHTYRDDRYPFNCDFYVKSEDLFIELNYFWSHGPKPYIIGDDECKKWELLLLEKAIKLNNKKYKESYDTWAVRDVKKMNIAISNNLKYVAIYKNYIYSLNYEFKFDCNSIRKLLN